MYQTIAFKTKLAPIATYLSDASITEIVINKPGELWFLSQQNCYMQCIVIPELTLTWARSLSQLIAYNAHQPISQESPLLSAVMPYEGNLYRIQIIWPPAVFGEMVILTIRKPSANTFTLSDYTKQQGFNCVNQFSNQVGYEKLQLKKLFHQNLWSDFLSLAVKAKLNIVISAGTNAGKTTLLNALLRETSLNERIVTIEDTREIFPMHDNAVHLLYSRSDKMSTAVSPVTLFESVLRLSPDRILMGELRGEEAYAYLELLNSGHTGTMTTIHADSPVYMFDRLAQMVMRFNPHFEKKQIIAYAKSLIHVVVQCQREVSGRRYISAIWCNDMLFEDEF